MIEALLIVAAFIAMCVWMLSNVDAHHRRLQAEDDEFYARGEFLEREDRWAA